MTKKLLSASRLLKIAAAALTLVAGQAQAVTLLGQNPDPAKLVIAGGLEWAYAAPCAGVDPSCGVVQLHNGFGFATDAQWLSSFANLAALLAAFNNQPQLCAATYFSTLHDHCDFGDLQLGFVWNSPLAASPDHARNGFAETFLVRGQVVPEPATLALVGLGLFAAGWSRKRKPV